jgi:endonuclease III related protein
MSQPRSSRPEYALRDFYRSVRGHFGYIETWWPGTPLELTLTAILVQQCDWSTAWAGLGRLRDHGLVDLESLADADPVQIESHIQPVAFAPTKARRLVGLSRTLVCHGTTTIDSLLDTGPTDSVRERLMDLPGVGPETADCILLFASDHHETFVVDAYTRRVFRRLELFSAVPHDFRNGPYETLRRFFLGHIAGFPALYDEFEFATAVPRSVALLRDFHAQIVELGKHHCLKTRPRCAAPGNAGWKDYPFCRGHCANNGCCACPLVATCALGAGLHRGREGQNHPSRSSERPASDTPTLDHGQRPWH